MLTNKLGPGFREGFEPAARLFGIVFVALRNHGPWPGTRRATHRIAPRACRWPQPRRPPFQRDGRPARARRGRRRRRTPPVVLDADRRAAEAERLRAGRRQGFKARSVPRAGPHDHRRPVWSEGRRRGAAHGRRRARRRRQGRPGDAPEPPPGGDHAARGRRAPPVGRADRVQPLPRLAAVPHGLQGLLWRGHRDGSDHRAGAVGRRAGRAGRRGEGGHPLGRVRVRVRVHVRDHRVRWSVGGPPEPCGHHRPGHLPRLPVAQRPRLHPRADRRRLHRRGRRLPDLLSRLCRLRQRVLRRAQHQHVLQGLGGRVRNLPATAVQLVLGLHQRVCRHRHPGHHRLRNRRLQECAPHRVRRPGRRLPRLPDGQLVQLGLGPRAQPGPRLRSALLLGHHLRLRGLLEHELLLLGADRGARLGGAVRRRAVRFRAHAGHRADLAGHVRVHPVTRIARGKERGGGAM